MVRTRGQKYDRYDLIAVVAGSGWFAVSSWLIALILPNADFLGRTSARTLLFFPIFVAIVYGLRRLRKNREPV